MNKIRSTSSTRRIVAILAAVGSSAFLASCDSSFASSTAPKSVTFTVTVKNVSVPGTIASDRAMGTIPLSPGAFAVFQGTDPTFTPGQSADSGTERIAEDGFPGPPLPGSKSTMLASAANVTASGVFQSPGGPDNGPAISAGETATFTITASPGSRLQFETMFVQSNDWFYGFGNGGLQLFNGNTPTIGDVTSQLVLYDAGTEQDTPPGTGAFQKPVQDPMAMNVGPSESVPIQTAAQRHPTYTIPATSSVIAVTVTPQK
ncbi:MAG: spondin domain-containing protein [Gemmatimonadaceae bacterium]